VSGTTVVEPVASGATAPDAPLVLQGIRKSFGSNEVLKGVDLTLDRGELLAVLGANGCGKSTLLRCAIRLVKPDAGSTYLLGRDLGALGSRGLREARRDAAVVFQQIALVKRRSAFTNVCVGALGRVGMLRSLRVSWLPAEVRRRAAQALKRVGLLDKAWQPAATLSGGQAQRVAIARAYCQEAAVILADEPVSALDPRAAEEVLALLADLAHRDRLAVLAVLHQPELALRYCDRVIGMKLGRVVFDKRPAEIAPAEIEALYEGLPEREEVSDALVEMGAESLIEATQAPALPRPQPAAPATAAPAVLPKRTRSRRSLIGWGLVLLAFAALLVYSWIDTQGSITQFFKGIFGSRGLISWIVPKAIPPDGSQFWPGLRACATTFACAILATTFAAILSILILPFGARNIAPARWVYELTRAVVAIMRAIPELIVLVLLSFVFSFSPFAIVVALTFHGVGIKGKLYSEAVEETDMTPIDALRVAGASRLQTFLHGVLPGVGGTLVALTLYRLDSDFRAAVTLGVVGGVGIGFLIDNDVNTFEFHAITTYMIVMVISILVVERVSTILRRRLAA
jgi:phosphonate transport system ATP-binding protein